MVFSFVWLLCIYICALAFVLGIRVHIGRFIRHRVKWVRARKQGLVVNCTAISLFCPVLLCLNCSLRPPFLIYCSFALPLFSINLPQPLSPILPLSLPCSYGLSFRKIPIKKKLSRSAPFFSRLIPNYPQMILLAPFSTLFPSVLRFPSLSLIIWFFFFSSCFLPFFLSLTISNSFYPYLALQSGFIIWP